MRCLLISRNFPEDITTSVHGIFKRLGIFIDALLAQVDHLDMLFYVRPDFDISHANIENYQLELRKVWGTKINIFLCPRALTNTAASSWRHYGAGVLNFFQQENYAPTSGTEQVLAFEACLRRKPCWIFAHRLHVMPLLMKTTKRLPPIFLDLDDIEHLAHYRRLIGFPRWTGERLKLLQIPALFLAERRAIRMTEATFLCSDIDQRYMRRCTGSNNLVTIPNSVAIPVTTTPIPDNQNLLFLGSFLHPPNVVAADYLVDNIWPKIISEVPSAILVIAGAGPDKTRNFLNPPKNVVYTGFVNDLGELYAKTRVVCCPILSGAGTRIKIVEAAAYSRPIISTTLGAEGLEFEEGKEILLRDDPLSFAQACVNLLRDPNTCEAIGNRANREVRHRYERNSVINKIIANIQAALSQKE